ncbi:hypothetical protein KCL53_002460 [Clostridium perfringens]|uniref:hypothetical protein n=1 Tax=Clostridium perfringens TaxID=1502 RepID=UPI001A184731|nr:hypothetical protein [Clostridium perfringens]EHK2349312.1 hypothetical protein [Clostridium perfringens]EHK2365741.1 hypothetical protein [Clostridium perfringens]EIF6153692.1 hypothetical protein [Clostridium perfringens]MDU1473941.1 hypothetical protein [Clostridium perfringens]MDU2827079.1 hypothetical protein [Clostridium perfringens]
MKKISLILIATLMLAFFSVGCSENNKEKNEKQNKAKTQSEINSKETVNNSTSEKEIKDESKSVQVTDLKDSKIYKEMSTLMPFEITDISSSILNNEKALNIKFNVKKGSIKDEINEFYNGCTLISSYISTMAEDEKFTYLIIINKELGAVATYAPSKSVNGFFLLEHASFSNEENKKIFDEISKGK